VCLPSGLSCFELTDRLVQLGKFGAFPAKQLLGRYYDVTYEIYQSANAVVPEAGSSSSGPASFGQGKGKKKKSGGGNGGGKGNVMSNPGWKNALKPLKEKPIIDAVVGMLLFTVLERD
jgi:tRNA (adenine-N(1)-)-methyltransferase non-catalytic subunit